ncbi:zinc-binding dehydrogenase [Streptomyces tanashiensis]|uniref:zinc-binding dehydrogenase n=1 Tax=Streptomyces tanashiensis TaxID=67367 RepID=UPI0034034851
MKHRTERTGGEGVDLILDHAGGPTFAECLPATRVDGSVVNIGRLDRAESAVDLDVLSYRHLRVRGVSFGFSWPEKLGAVLSGAVSALAPALLDGRVQPLIDSRYDFRTAFEAVRRIASHQALGKIVLAVP